MSKYLIGSRKTKDAKKLLEKMGGGLGKKLLKNFFDVELKLLKNKDERTIISASLRERSNVYKFARLLRNRPSKVGDKDLGLIDRKIFRQAIECQAKSLSTSSTGLFYTLIWQSGNLNMNALDSSKIKTFLMAKNDREKDIVDPDVNDEDRKLHRMNFKNLGKKLNSARLSNILKALIALILWCYIIQTQQEGELEKTVDPNPNKISINDKIKRRWQTIKHSQTTGGKKDFDEMVKEASDAHRDLTQRGLLYEGDNSRNSESARGFSTNFVRLFIRYVQRTFSELDNYVKIYYYQSTCFYYGGEESERKDKEYWGKIKSLVTSSKEDGMIYFVVNQYVSNERTNVNDGGGHGNLTIVCGGNYKVFETVRGCEDRVMGEKDYDKNDMNITSGTIQADAQNCLTIALGYMESLMKQIYGWSKEQQWSSQKKEFSEYVWNKINRYSTVNLPDDIQGVDREPLKVLLPAKYIKYIQTSAGRDKLIELAKSKTLREEDRDAIEEVAEELIKVRDRYNLSEKPLEPFLRDVAENDSILQEWLKPRLNKIAKAAGMKLSEMKWKDVKEFMGKKRIKATFDEDSESKYQIIWKKSSGERVKLSLTSGPEGNISEPIVKIFSEQMPEERNDVERELINNPIYKVVSDNPETISWSKLEDDEREFFRYMENILRMNDPAQMRRRKNILKIATLVDVLEDSKPGSSKDEMSKVEYLVKPDTTS